MKKITTHRSLSSGLWLNPERSFDDWTFGVGIGIPDFELKDNGLVQVTDETNGKVYQKPKAEIRKWNKKHPFTQLRGTYNLVITPVSEWEYRGTKVELEEKRKEELLRAAAGY